VLNLSHHHFENKKFKKNASFGKKQKSSQHDAPHHQGAIELRLSIYQGLPNHR
jgi:hypothetical protein